MSDHDRFQILNRFLRFRIKGYGSKVVNLIYIKVTKFYIPSSKTGFMKVKYESGNYGRKLDFNFSLSGILVLEPKNVLKPKKPKPICRSIVNVTGFDLHHKITSG